MANILSSKHPEYQLLLADWLLMRDCYQGERQIKSKNELYLPMTASQVLDGGRGAVTSKGYLAYMAYQKRAVFFNFVREAVQSAIGMMHSKPADIKLPKAMEKIRGRNGETLQYILRKINTEQLLTGRIGVMADIPVKTTPDNDIPYITLYESEKIVNWDDGAVETLIPQKLNLVVLDESEQVRDVFTWTKKEKARVLTLGPMESNENAGEYFQGVFVDDSEYAISNMKAPQWKGRTLNEIPFTIINSCDVTADVDDPPLLDLANISLAIYRGEADYRQNLYMQGQDTFVTIGGMFSEEDSVRLGTGARIDLPQGGDAKFVGVTGDGLSEQREALDRLTSRASSMGAQTLDSTSRERESGDSLRLRIAARTADMNQVVEAGAFGLELVLKSVAKWMDEDPEEVKVTPNKEFGDMPLTGQSMVEIATARNLGWPISAKSMHDLSVKRHLTTKTFEEEVEEAEKEDTEDFVFGKPKTPDQAPVQPNDPNNPNKGEGGKPKGQTTHPSGRTQKS
jgi:hypothetical protein